MLLMIHPPGAVPAGWGWILLQRLDPAEQRQRRSIVGHSFQGGVEAVARFVPAAGAVGGEPLGVAVAQGDLVFGERTLLAEHLEYPLRAGLTEHDDAIDLACLDRVAGGHYRGF